MSIAALPSHLHRRNRGREGRRNLWPVAGGTAAAIFLAGTGQPFYTATPTGPGNQPAAAAFAAAGSVAGPSGVALRGGHRGRHLAAAPQTVEIPASLQSGAAGSYEIDKEYLAEWAAAGVKAPENQSVVQQGGLVAAVVVLLVAAVAFFVSQGKEEDKDVAPAAPAPAPAAAPPPPSPAPAAESQAPAGMPRAAINGFGRIGRNVLRCWLGRKDKAFDIVAINVGSMGAKTAAHLLKYDTVLGTLQADVSSTEDEIIVDGRSFKVVSGRDPATMPWSSLGVEVVIESTGAFNSMEGGSKHLEAGAKKVVLTAPGKECPTYVVGVNEDKYDPVKDTVVSNASCTTNGMASVCKVLDDTFGVEYGMMTTTHSYTGDQLILDGRHRDLRRARAGACNIVPTSTGAAKAVAEVLPQFKGKLNGIALRVPTPNVSVVDLVVQVSKKCSKEDVNGALKAAAEGPMEGIINFEEQPLVSSDFRQTDYSNSVDAALTLVMGEDLVKVVMWYDNEWGYSQRVVDLTALVAKKLPVMA